MVTSDLVLSFSWFVDFAQYEQWQDFAITAPKQAAYIIRNMEIVSIQYFVVLTKVRFNSSEC